MQIDVQKDKLIRLGEVPRLPWLPPGRGGKPVRVTTVFRWAQRGIDGVLLETVAVGGAKCTTEAALLRFFERLGARPGTPDRTPAQANAAFKHAERALDSFGI